MGMSKQAKVMKVGDDKQHDKAGHLWFKQKQMESVPTVSQARYCMKKLCSYTGRCRAKSQVSLKVQDGNGGSARGMEYTACPLKVKITC